MHKSLQRIEPIISVHNVRVSFGEVQALRETSFEVLPGEIFGLVGSDGAGKTTLLRLIAGMLKPDAGNMLICGMDGGRDRQRIKPLVGYMPQRFGLYPDLSVEENIDFFLDMFGVEPDKRAARKEKYLGFSGMLAFLNRAAGDLSGGMKQKLGLACVLAHEPTVLILDEPTNGVDPVSRREFWEILQSMRQAGMTIMASTAYIDEGEYCDRLALMHAGRIVMIEKPSYLKASDATLEAALIGRLLEADKELTRDAFGN